MLAGLLALFTLFGAFVSGDLPSNAQCSTAQTISELGLVAFDNTQANSTVLTTCTVCSHFLWYKWNASFTGYLQVSTCGMAAFDTVLSVYTDCANFPSNYLSCDNNYCDVDSTSLLNAPVVEGLEYFIAVAGWGSESGSGNFSLSSATLKLILFTNSVPLTGGLVQYIVETDATSPFTVNVTVSCISGYELSVQVPTSPFPQNFTIAPQTNYTSCTIIAADPINPGLTSQSSDFYVADELILLLPGSFQEIQVGQTFTTQVSTIDYNVNMTVNVNVTCVKGSQVYQTLTNFINYNSILTNGALFGYCQLSAVTEPVEYAIRDKSSVYVTTVLNLTLPLNNTSLVVTEPLNLLAMADPAAAGLDVNFRIECSDQFYFFYPGRANQLTLYPFEPTYANSTCAIYAVGEFFTQSETVTISLLVPDPLIPTQLEADLSGWQGGHDVTITVSASIGGSFPLDFNVECPVRKQTFAIRSNQTEVLQLAEDLNGIGCVLTTSGMPIAYAPITPTFVNILLSDALEEAIIRAINPASFIEDSRDQ